MLESNISSSKLNDNSRVAAARQAVADAWARQDPDLEPALGRLSALYDALAVSPAQGAAQQAELGDLWMRLERYAQAHAAYERAVALDADNIRYRFNRAAVLAYLGRDQDAENDYDWVLLRAPLDGMAQLNRSQLRRQTSQRNHLEALQQALTVPGGDWRREVPLRYALAKELTDLGEHAEAAKELAQGAGLRRRHLDYDVQRDLDTLTWITEAFPETQPPPAESSSPGPIFVVSLPRTGSTLVDRMLSSHPRIISIGERPEFAQALVSAVEAHFGKLKSREALIRASAQLDFMALGRDYARRVSRFVGSADTYIDKMPLNYLYCGLIAQALPSARFVHVRRGPMATCFAIHRTLFEQGYPFAYDLRELADYWIGYERLMAHWRQRLPGRFTEIAYEDLVVDAETTLRAAMPTIGVDFDPACLHFHENPAPSSTASASQVRRPLYRESLDLWRHYRHLLKPAADRLRQAGIVFES